MRRVRAYLCIMIDFLESWIGDLSGHDKSRFEAAQRKAEVSLAGAALRRLRMGQQQRPPKKWTGWIGHRRRGVVGQTVILPDRSLGRLIAARRGWACVAWVDPFSVRRNRISYFAAGEILPYKNPCAAALGRMKAGRREIPSAIKAQAARRNGKRPVRQGSRPRGRPRHNQAARTALLLSS